MSTMATRRYGLPWAGYRSSQAPHLTPPNYATSDGPSVSTRRSKNFRYNPLEGKFYRREGTAVSGSSTGVLENGTGELNSTARCRKLMSLRSTALSDGYPTYCTLWSAESEAKGCIHFYSTNDNGGSPYGDTVLEDEWSTTVNYPITAGGGVPYSRAWPVLRTTDDTMGRFHSLALRAQANAGARAMQEMGDWLYTPNFHGTPWRWNKVFNDASDGTSVLRIHHVGRPSPLGIPDINTGTVGTGPDASWHDADIFFVSVAYRFADGSVSMPIIPRERNDDVNYDPGLGNMTGFGKVQINSAGSTQYRWLVWQNIPIGPSDCVGRYLLRTPKNAAGADTDPAPLDLKITAYLPNNTQTTYNDPNGNDLSLVDDPLIVRFDHIMMPPSRYLGTCDQKMVCAYTKIHPVAIYLAPFVNVSDGDSTIDDVVYSYSLTGGTLTLNKDAGSTTLTNIGDDSIQALVDRINNTTGGGGGGKWFACIAPGADPTVTCDDLGTAADNDNLVSVTGATDFAGDGNGIVRAWGSSWPAPIFFSSTYRANFETAKRRLFFTMGGPGMPANAGDSWSAGNVRDVPENYGDIVGVAPLLSGAVVICSKGVMVLQNRRAGVSGEDIDYRLYDLNPARGCISPYSIVAFNGAVGYMTSDGYVVTDGRAESLISGDIWKSQGQIGEWAYEMSQQIPASGADNDENGFHAAVMGGVLYINYRLQNTSYARVEYDFSGSAQFSGLSGLLRPDGAPWGWSTPLHNPVSFHAMGEIRDGSGIQRYAVADGRPLGGMSSSGVVYQIETGTDDGGTDFTSQLWTARDVVDAMRKKSVRRIASLHKKNGAGLTLRGWRDTIAEDAKHSMSATLPTTGTTFFKKLNVRVPQTMRTATDAAEFRYEDDGTNDAPEIFGLEVEYAVLDSHN